MSFLNPSFSHSYCWVLSLSISTQSNRFDLVLTAAQRARNIQKGELLTIDRDDDKNPVIALREIADETQSADALRERLIESNQTQIEVDEPEDDSMSLLMSGEQDRPVEDDMTEA